MSTETYRSNKSSTDNDLIFSSSQCRTESDFHLSQREKSSSANLTPRLLAAATIGDLSLVKAMLEQGAEINGRDTYGASALLLAAGNGFIDIVRALISQGADIDMKNINGRTALMRAAQEGHVDIVKELIDSGACLNEIDRKGKTALLFAAACGFSDIVEIIKNRALEIQTKNINS